MYKVIIDKKGNYRQFNNIRSAYNFIREHNEEILNIYYYKNLCDFCPIKSTNCNQQLIEFIKKRCDRADLYFTNESNLKCKNRIFKEPNKIPIRQFEVKENSK